ncbi:dihydrofolate reductase [Paenibacillus cellulosilyticus]|uniref:dihydrofolate reductase family protein n=1 Tax=Paenibacillus cellulosilyticus TaxID=375489 RepID=UPI00157FE66C|nr:dihydrofolate reductase family protein [Paenibacillus cellulosilyticus]QKS44937.1 dihydrofolate reductase [Paenibacillus cellulosilyticus]
MRKIILNLAISLDGFIEGSDGEFDWCFSDQDYSDGQLDQFDAVFMGRKSYELMINLNEMPIKNMKNYIFSDSLDSVKYGSLIRSSNMIDEVNKIKEDPGNDIWFFGGADLLTSFLEEGLIDELQLAVHPILLGKGKNLFQGKLNERIQCTFISAKSYDTGLVMLRYKVKSN